MADIFLEKHNLSKYKNNKILFAIFPILTIAIIILIGLFLSSCNSQNTKEYRPTPDNVKLIGRTYTSDKNNLWCSYSGSGIEFITSANKCSVNFISDDIYAEPDNKNARVGIFIDGKMKKNIMMNEINNKKIFSCDLISNESKNEHTIKIIKLSEGQDSTFGIEKIIANDTIVPTENKSSKIEFVGDSITCGYGIECESEEDSYSTSIENCTKAYAYKLADKLKFDYSLVCVSGIGVISGYTSNPNIKKNKLMKDSYENFGISDSKFEDDIDPQKQNWDFNNFQPDFIVVNLGTNDNSYVNNDYNKAMEFVESYKNLIQQIRNKNPKAQIICCYGTMDQNLIPYVELAVNKFSEEKSDNKISFIALEQIDKDVDGIAIQGHPSEKTNEKIAETLYNFIEDNYLNKN